MKQTPEEQRPPVVDADGHLMEDLARVAELIDPSFRHLAPRYISQGETDLFVLGGEFIHLNQGMAWSDLGRLDGLKEDERKLGRRQEVYVPHAIDPDARLKLMDDYGIFASVLYPSTGLFLGLIDDPAVYAAVARGVNRYMAEFCSSDLTRLHNVATVPISDVERACNEARYAVEELHAVAIYAPPGLSPKPIYHPAYEPFWDTMAELGVPFCTHAGAIPMRKGLGVERFPGRWPAFHLTTHVIEGMLACLGLVAYGVLERHRDLKVGFMECGCGWVPFWLEAIDDKRKLVEWMMPELSRSAEETFRDQCVVTSESGDELLPGVLSELKGRGVVWASDIPHADAHDGGRPRGVWGDDRLSGQEKNQVLSHNAVEFYGLKVPSRV